MYVIFLGDEKFEEYLCPRRKDEKEDEDEEGKKKNGKEFSLSFSLLSACLISDGLSAPCFSL